MRGMSRHASITAAKPKTHRMGATIQTSRRDWRRSRAGEMALGGMALMQGWRAGAEVIGGANSLGAVAAWGWVDLQSSLGYSRHELRRGRSFAFRAGEGSRDREPAGGLRAMRMAAAAGLAACAGAMAGCGNTYRPVLATIGVQGPAGQPTKYAIAVSSPSQTSVPGPTVFEGSWSAGTTMRSTSPSATRACSM